MEEEIRFMENNEHYIIELYHIIKKKYDCFLDNMEFHTFSHFILDNRFNNYTRLRYTRNITYFEEEYYTEINNTFKYLEGFRIHIDNWIDFCYKESFN